MFTLHEQTRLLLCRTSFLVLCVLPTFITVAFVWRFRSPGYLQAQREEWLAVLSDKLGVNVDCDCLSYPAWNSALLENLVFRDAETDAEVARARYAEVSFQSGSGWQVIVGEPELQVDSFHALASGLQDRLLRGRAFRMAPLTLESRVFTVQRAGRAQSFQNVALTLTTENRTRALSLQADLPTDSEAIPLQLEMRRSVEGSPRTTLHCRTTKRAVPLDALQVPFPWLEALGSTSTFHGEVTQETTSGDLPSWHTQGTLDRVDLARLVSPWLQADHEITGEAQLLLESVVWKNGALVEARGRVQNHAGGEITQGLVQALANGLQLAPPAKHDTWSPLAGQRLRYKNLAFGFELDRTGLKLSGDVYPSDTASASNRGVLLASARADLLVESTEAVIPTVALVQALAPLGDAQLPLSPAARQWFQLLPASPGISPEEVSRARPTGRLRLRRDLK